MALLCGQRNLGDVVLVDIMEGVAKGKALDLQQTRGVLKFDVEVTGGGTTDYSVIKDADVCIVTAGVPRKPGMSRDDLLKVNLEAITKVAQGIKQYAPGRLRHRGDEPARLDGLRDVEDHRLPAATGWSAWRACSTPRASSTSSARRPASRRRTSSRWCSAATATTWSRSLRYSSVNGTPAHEAARQGEARRHRGAHAQGRRRDRGAARHRLRLLRPGRLRRHHGGELPARPEARAPVLRPPRRAVRRQGPLRRRAGRHRRGGRRAGHRARPQRRGEGDAREVRRVA